MILWYVDRFGLPGQYHRIWVRLLRDNYIPLAEVQVVSLHKLMAPRQLLTRYMTRKAPTWNPDLGPEITARIDAINAKMKPRAVVLSSPESLACLGLAPEHATLHNLRGSVYRRSGIPHLVMLPMSAWNSLVSQKEIGAANYGFESQETFTAARSHHGEIREAAGTGGNLAAGGAADVLNASGGLGFGGRGSAQVESPARDSRPVAGGAGRFAHLSNRGAVAEQAGQGSGDVESGAVRDGHVPGEDDGGAGDSGYAGTPDPDDGAIPDDPDDDSGEAGEGGSEDADSGGVDDGDDGVSSPDGGPDDAGDPESRDPEDGELDQFFYEPVLSPVGRFVLTADTQKLFRILRDGINASGPARPIEVEWH